MHKVPEKSNIQILKFSVFWWLLYNDKTERVLQDNLTLQAISTSNFVRPTY